MAKGKVPLGSKNFFMMTVLSVAVLGTMFMTFAAQQKTNTQSHAYTCRVKPNLNLVKSRDYANRIVYLLDVKNVNSKSCNKVIKYALKVTNAPNKNWKFTFAKTGDNFSTNSFDNACRDGKLSYGETDHWKLEVIPPSGASKGTYYFKVNACEGKPAASVPGDDWCSFDPTTNCVTTSLKYIKS